MVNRDGGANRVKPYKTGLVVGKFCPLHKGHEYLIETAQAACARLILISYTKPGYAGCEVEKRRHWLTSIYPNAICLVIDDKWLAGQAPPPEFAVVPHDDADEHLHRRFTAWLSHTILGETVDAIFTSESYGDGFAAVMSASQSAPVQHICVDRARETIPISGTHIRQNPARRRAYLSDIVIASFIKRAVFLGGESTGKSTLARRLAARMETQFAAEFGRELWEQKDGVLIAEDMLHIAQTQIARETALAARSDGWLFCDTSPLTTLFYAQDMFGYVAPELESLSRRNYDLTFLCRPDFDFVQDGTRQGLDFTLRQHAWYIENLTQRGVAYIELAGPLDIRIETVMSHISTFPEN